MRPSVLVAVLVVLVSTILVLYESAAVDAAMDRDLKACIRKCVGSAVVPATCIKSCKNAHMIKAYFQNGKLTEADARVVRQMTEQLLADELMAEEFEQFDDEEEELEEDSFDEDVMADAQPDSSALWDRYKTSLFLFLKRHGAGKGGDSFMGLQMVSEPTEATWHESGSTFDLNIFANKVSAWGDSYEPTALRFPDQYNRFLDNIRVAPLSGISAAAIKEKEVYEQEVEDYLFQMEDERLKCMELWDQYRDFLNADYDNAFETKYCKRLGSMEFQKTRMLGMLQELRTRAAGPNRDVYDAVANYMSDDTKHGWFEWNSLSSFVSQARSGQATKFSIQVDSSTNVKETRTWTKKKKSGFIFKKTRTESKTEVRFNNELFNMRFEAAGFAGIRISPRGNWFDANVVSKYKNQSLWKNQGMQFFGEKGTISLLPRTVYVVYKPRVVLDLSKEDGEYFNQYKSSSWSFGPFASKNSVSTMTVNQVNAEKYQVTFTSNVDAPLIIAVDNDIL